jgi:ABC-type dipeptide/oligopeptide/nickel transport system permease component
MYSRLVLKKSAGALFLIAVATVLNFLLFRLAPGDAASAYHVPHASPELEAALRREFGLDQSTLSQFWHYVVQLLHGNLGISTADQQPVASNLASALGNTLLLALPGLVLALGLAFATGIASAWWRGTAGDHVSRGAALTLYAIPAQWLAMMLILAFKDVLPSGGISDPFLAGGDFLTATGDKLRHMVLPVTTYALVVYGQFMIVVRNSMLEVLSEDYILAAKAKGLSSRTIIRRHALRNALVPVTTMIALTVGWMVGGVILIETAFSWPGVGHAMYDAVSQRDLPMLQGGFLLLTVVVVLANLIVDLAYTKLDPRVRL